MKYMLVALAIVVSFTLISMPAHAEGPLDAIAGFFRAIWEFFFGKGGTASATSTLELKCIDDNGNYADECTGETAEIKWLMQDFRSRIDFCKASSTPSNMDWYGYKPFTGNATVKIDSTTTFTLLCRGDTLTLSDSIKVIHPSQIVEEESEETPQSSAEEVTDSYEEIPYEESNETQSTGNYTYTFEKVKAMNSPAAGIVGGSIRIIAELKDMTAVSSTNIIKLTITKDGITDELTKSTQEGECSSSCLYTWVRDGLLAGTYTYSVAVVNENWEEIAETSTKQFIVYGTTAQIPSIAVTHSPENPVAGDIVTFTATATQYTGKIMVVTAEGPKFPKTCDGRTCYSSETKTKTCTSSPCKLVVLYDSLYAFPGIYGYSAYLVENGLTVAADPAEGAKSMTLHSNGTDSHPPAVSVLSKPLDPSIFSIRAYADDAESIPTVSIYLNDEKVETCSTPPCSFIVSGNDGTYYYKASATDMSGKTSWSPSLNFTINSTKPLIVLLSPYYGEKLFAPGDYCVYWDFIDPTYSTDMTTKLFLKKGTMTEIGEAPATGEKFCWSVNPQLALGSYKLMARLMTNDDIIYEVESDDAFTVLRPTVKFTSVPTSMAIANETRIRWDIDGTGDYATSLWLEKDGAYVGDITPLYQPWRVGTVTSSGETVILNASTNYKFAVKIERGGYNYTARSATVSVTAPQETEKPSISVSFTPQNPQSTDTIIFTAHATDNRALKNVTLIIDGVPLTCTAPYLTEYDCEYSAIFPQGTYYYDASATDAAGNTKWFGNTTFYVSLAPTLTLTTMNGETVYRPGSAREVRWTTNAQSSDNYYVRLMLRKDGSDLGKLELADIPATAGYVYWNTNYYYDNTTLTQTVPGGGYTISATIVNNGALTSVADESDEAFSIEEPYITLISHQDGLALTRNTTSVVSWDVTGDGRYAKKFNLERNGQNMGSITTFGYASTATEYIWSVGLVKNDIGSTYTVPAGTGYRIVAKIEDYDGSGYANTSTSASFAIL